MEVAPDDPYGSAAAAGSLVPMPTGGVPQDPMTRDELVAAVQTLMTGGTGTEAGDDELLNRVRRSVLYPEVQTLIFYSEGMTPQEIVDALLAYRPIPL